MITLNHMEDINMLLQFSVGNFRSIRDTAVLSLEASADKSHTNNIVKQGKDTVLKSAVIYGANAAGKSNIFKALTAAILTVRESDIRQVGAPLIHIVPFKFDKEYIDAPTEFEFVFNTDGKKYVYGFSATFTEIVTEYLYEYKTAKATTVFIRDEREKEVYKFTNPAYQKNLKPVVDKNTKNKLFLATATNWNCEETKIPFLWLTNLINTYDTKYDQLISLTGPMFEDDADGSLKRFTSNLIKEADINISDYSIQSRELVGEGDLPPELGGGHGTIFRQKQYAINTLHEIESSDNGEKTQVSLNLKDESAGTQNLFFFSPILKRAFSTGETICIDEFDANMHPMLLEFIVGLFNDPEINIANAQLIISSHNTTLLNLELLRRDQFYFIEKDNKTGSSELFSMDEFSVRKSEDVRRAYLLGRFGAIPNIGEGYAIWQ